MPTLDDLAPNYSRATSKWPQASTLRAAHGALSAYNESNCQGTVESVKAFIETTCRTILIDHGEQPSRPRLTLRQLLVETLKVLGFENSRGQSKLDKVLDGFASLSDALDEMRNHNGTIAHGKDGYLESITWDHARAFVYTGDAILGFLINAYEGKEPNVLFTRDPYE